MLVLVWSWSSLLAQGNGEGRFPETKKNRHPEGAAALALLTLLGAA